VLYSDFTCPTCFLEFTRLRRALEELPSTQRPPLLHGSFQLDATLPVAGVDKYEYLSALVPPAVLDPMIDDLCAEFRQVFANEDLEMNPRGLLGNSAAAHRLALYAQDHCAPATALALKDALFQIHSIQGKSMGDTEALLAAAAQAGVPNKGGAVTQVIAASNREYAAKVGRQILRAKEILGITAVPALVVVAEDGEERVLEGVQDIKTVEGFKELLWANLE